jgi:hypothetical protein
MDMHVHGMNVNKYSHSGHAYMYSSEYRFTESRARLHSCACRPASIWLDYLYLQAVQAGGPGLSRAAFILGALREVV